MASVTKYAGVIATTSNGGKAWTNLSNAVGYADDLHALMDLSRPCQDFGYGLIKNGALYPINQFRSGVNWGYSPAYTSYGSSTSITMWGQPLTASDVNNSGFGFSLAGTHTTIGSCNMTYYTQTGFIKATNFGFSLPAGAQIKGLVAEVRKHQLESGIGDACIDCIRITLYYTDPASFFTFFK